MIAEEELPLVSLGNLKAAVWQQFDFKKNHNREELDRKQCHLEMIQVSSTIQWQYNKSTRLFNEAPPRVQRQIVFPLLLIS